MKRRARRRQTQCFRKWLLWRETCFSAAPHETSGDLSVLLAIYAEAAFEHERLRKPSFLEEAVRDERSQAQ